MSVYSLFQIPTYDICPFIPCFITRLTTYVCMIHNSEPDWRRLPYIFLFQNPTNGMCPFIPYFRTQPTEYVLTYSAISCWRHVHLLSLRAARDRTSPSVAVPLLVPWDQWKHAWRDQSNQHTSACPQIYHVSNKPKYTYPQIYYMSQESSIRICLLCYITWVTHPNLPYLRYITWLNHPHLSLRYTMYHVTTFLSSYI